QTQFGVRGRAAGGGLQLVMNRQSHVRARYLMGMIAGNKLTVPAWHDKCQGNEKAHKTSVMPVETLSYLHTIDYICFFTARNQPFVGQVHHGEHEGRGRPLETSVAQPTS